MPVVVRLQLPIGIVDSQCSFWILTGLYDDVISKSMSEGMISQTQRSSHRENGCISTCFAVESGLLYMHSSMQMHVGLVCSAGSKHSHVMSATTDLSSFDAYITLVFW